MNDVYIFDALRTPFGKGNKNGALYEVKPVELLTTLLNAIRDKYNLDTSKVDDCIMGCVTPIGDQGSDIAKTSLLYAGWHNQVSGVQLNRFSASGLEAINIGAAKVRSGWEDMVIAGGIECMSRVPMGSDGGALMYDPEISIRINYVPQGVGADLIATKEGITRMELDEYAIRAHQRANRANEKGFYEKSLIPIKDKNGLPILMKDETLRATPTLEQLEKLQPSFEQLGNRGFDEVALSKYPFIDKINHIHTAGNSCENVDGAAITLLGCLTVGKEMGLRPRAKILAVANACTEPTVMLEGATPAAHKVLKKAGLKPTDIDLWEVNESFAATIIKFQRDFGLTDDNLNINGGAIAYGYPLGAIGAVMLTHLLDALEERNLKRGLLAVHAGGGMGVATIIERVG